MNLPQFKVPKRKKKCLKCSKSFEEGMNVYSLVKGDEEDLIREDYCENCFYQDLVLSEAVWGHWETLLKKPRIQRSIDQRAMDLFLEKMDEGSAEWVYFLAHYLKRKKQLIARSEIKKEGYLFFEEPISTEIYSVKDIPISMETLSHLKENFISKLNEPQDNLISNSLKS